MPLPHAPGRGTGWELILNAAEGVLQIILTEDEELFCAQEWAHGHHAAEILAPALAQVFSAAGIRARDLRRLACVRGPGSFTGIRLVLATAAALRRTTRVQLAGLDYLQALATSVAIADRLPYGDRIWVLTHARRGLTHCQEFISLGWQIPSCPAAPAVLLSPADALAAIRASLEEHDAARAVRICGGALARNPELATADARDLAGRVLVSDRPNPSVAALRLLGRHGDYEPADVEPFYLRPCDAAENVASLAERLGMDGAGARADLERMLQRPPESGI